METELRYLYNVYTVGSISLWNTTIDIILPTVYNYGKDIFVRTMKGDVTDEKT